MNATPRGGARKRRGAGAGGSRGRARRRSEGRPRIVGALRQDDPKEWHWGAEERFQQLIEHSSDIITILDGQGIIRFESPSVERVLGYTPKELLGRRAFDLIHPDDVGKVLALFSQQRAVPGVAPSIEFRLRHKDGS